MKKITLNADERLIEVARLRARDESTTLNALFRQWLADYAHGREPGQTYEKVMTQLRGRLQVGRKLSRDERNER